MRAAEIAAAKLELEKARVKLRACARNFTDSLETEDEYGAGVGLERAAIIYTEALAELRRREPPGTPGGAS